MQVGQVAQSLHRLHRNDEVGSTLTYEVRVDGFGREAQVRLHVTSALAHAVYLGLLEVQSCHGSGIAYDGGNGEDALTSHTSQYDIFLHYFLLFLSLRFNVCIHSRRGIMTDTPS